MSATEIRLRYSTIMNYIAMIYRLVISVSFTIIVARKLPPQDFGLWGIVVSMTTMLAAPWGIIAFWLSREIARKEFEALKAGTTAALAYTGIAVALHILLGLLQSRLFGWPLEAFLISAPMTALTIIDAYLSSVISVVKPEGIGYKNVVLDTVRIMLAIVVLYMLGRTVTVPITAYTAGLLASSATSLTILLRLGLRPSLGGFGKIKEWLTVMYIPLANILRGIILNSTRAIASWITGNEITAAYLNVGMSSQSVITRASQQSTPALYAKLLRGSNGKVVEEVLRLFILMTAFMVSSFIVLSKTIASLYNPLYIKAWPILVILSAFAFFEGLANIFTTAALGSVRSEKLTWESLKKTPLFNVTYARLVTSIASLFFGCALASISREDYLLAAEYFSGSLLGGSLVFVIWVSRNVKNSLKFRMPLREVITGIISSTVVALYYVAVGLHKLVITNFWSSAPFLIIHGLSALALYAVVWLTLSNWFKRLASDSIRRVWQFFTG